MLSDQESDGTSVRLAAILGYDEIAAGRVRKPFYPLQFRTRCRLEARHRSGGYRGGCNGLRHNRKHDKRGDRENDSIRSAHHTVTLLVNLAGYLAALIERYWLITKLVAG